MARDIKANSSKWINEQKMIMGKFNWQEGFGAFTYSKSQIDAVAKYILNQPEHHKKTSFKDEYIDFLKKFEIDYDEKYLFKWND
jgi:mono/diheme cytochrome c family protein